MTIKKKLKGKSGFTLAETLLAVLILLLVSTIVANGIPMARNVYNNVIVGANAQMLLSTAVTALRNELGTAQDIEIKSDNTTVTYYNPSTQSYAKISLNSTDPKTKTIMVDPYISPTDRTTSLNGSEPRELVTKAASNGDLFVTYEKAEYDKVNAPDIIVYKNIQIKRRNGAMDLITSLDELKIRLVPVAGEDA